MKTLITGGCSFTAGNGSEWPGSASAWPSYLSHELSLRLVNTAVAGIGNRAIARRTIHAVEKELSQPKVKHSDILVGICWSSSARSEYFLRTINRNSRQQLGPRHWTKFIYEEEGDWISLNSNWLRKGAKDAEFYYKWFHDPLGGVINTLESIMWVQNYLQAKGINYFMTTISPATYGYDKLDSLKDEDKKDDFTRDNGHLSWMWNSMKDQEYAWLPVESYWDWLFDKNDESLFAEGEFVQKIWDDLWKWGEEKDGKWRSAQKYPGWHPSKKAHSLFTREIILPYLKKEYTWI